MKKNELKAIEATTAVANSKKVNSTPNYEKLFNELCECNTKHQLVDAMNKNGYRTTTQPTDTPNKNDLYIQFIDKSRVLISSKSLKVYTNDENASELKDFTFDKVNDGSYRTKRATIAKTVENFNKVFDYFNQKYDIKLPTAQVGTRNRDTP